jgi:hypothetical protein
MDSFPNDKWSKPQIQAFLKARNLKTTGNKPKLLDLAILYKDELDCDALSFDEAALTTKREIFTVCKDWVNFQNNKVDVPKEFEREVINKFLTSTEYLHGDNAEVVSSGTVKPAKKGRLLYSSEKIQSCEVGQHNGCILFRCIMEASLKKNEFRFVSFGFFGCCTNWTLAERLSALKPNLTRPLTTIPTYLADFNHFLLILAAFVKTFLAATASTLDF